MGQNPILSVLAQAQQLSALSQNLSRQVVEGVELVGAGSDAAKARGAEFALQRLDVLNPELDFDFVLLRHGVRAIKRTSAA
jgi:hypothetical protein